ncbi:MAG: hypothetical protein ACJ779_00005, partial [Chloroflexota bacterium]
TACSRRPAPRRPHRDRDDGVLTEYGPGVGWPEDRHTSHWLENRGTTPAVEISVDIVRKAER